MSKSDYVKLLEQRIVRQQQEINHWKAQATGGHINAIERLYTEESYQRGLDQQFEYLRDVWVSAIERHLLPMMDIQQELNFLLGEIRAVAIGVESLELQKEMLQGKRGRIHQLITNLDEIGYHGNPEFRDMLRELSLGLKAATDGDGCAMLRNFFRTNPNVSASLLRWFDIRDSTAGGRPVGMALWRVSLARRAIELHTERRSWSAVGVQILHELQDIPDDSRTPDENQQLKTLLAYGNGTSAARGEYLRGLVSDYRKELEKRG